MVTVGVRASDNKAFEGVGERPTTSILRESSRETLRGDFEGTLTRDSGNFEQF